MTIEGSPTIRPGFVKDVMLIQSIRVVTQLGELNQSDLKFFVDNPRVYSIVREENENPSQEEIQTKLEDLEHVKQLVHDIRRHGGLIDPLVVKDGSLEVVEGNSRLAAYRILARTQPIKWGMVKCRLLPADISDTLVSSLLGQWHLQGKKEWPPYEQAGYLFRRHITQNVPIQTLAAEAALTSKRIEKIIEAYQLMIDHHDAERARWSYYDEYVKSAKIGKAREKHPELDDLIVQKIKSGEIERAQDLRGKLPLICAAPHKVMLKFLGEKIDFDEAVEAAQDAGTDHGPLKRLKSFRDRIADEDNQEAILASEGAVRARVIFELKQLEKIVVRLLKKLE